MADIDKITVNNTTYNIKDSTARDSISHQLDSEATALDCDDLTETGIYYASNNSSNLPASGKGGMIIVKKANSAVILQLAVLNGQSTGTLYVRETSSPNTWRAWRFLV